MEKVRNFFKDESGVSAVEYTIMAALLAMLLLAGVATFYTRVSNLFSELADKFKEL